MTRNNADFHGVTFAYKGKVPMHGFGPDDGPWAHLFTAHKEGKQVGKLQLQPGGTIDIIETHPDYQRQGIATGLYNFAKQESVRTDGELPYPKQSSIRSPEGDKWAKSTGEHLPPNEAE
jgi:GNAT superfamily N-acetyltransferase